MVASVPATSFCTDTYFSGELTSHVFAHLLLAQPVSEDATRRLRVPCLIVGTTKTTTAQFVLQLQ